MPSTQLPKLDALPDTIDFRDVMYVPSLIEVPPQSDLAAYRNAKIPVLDQGEEGACTGYGLATVANYLLAARGKKPLANEVSAWMFYTMAKRYDEWPGEDYSGSSARGAMKGWHKHGVCALALWKDSRQPVELTVERAADAIKRPLGAYFRVNHRDLVSMHAALAEVGVLFATSRVHSGWKLAHGKTDIPFTTDQVGAHAFAIIGYDQEGLWIQNSWGASWGDKGLGRLSYADWLANATDVWVASLGVPVDIKSGRATATMRAGSERSNEGYVYASLRPHLVTAKDNGELDDKGTFGLTPAALHDLVSRQLPARTQKWSTKRLLLYAHGGLVSESAAVQHVANNLDAALAKQVYPISFIWRTDAWSTICDILRDAISSRRDEGVLDAAKDFMLDRLDDTIEVAARLLGGKALWDEMKENAQGATTGQQGAARLAADEIASLHQSGGLDEIHLAGHSAGSIFMAYLAEYLVGKGLKIKSVSLWAPAMTMDLFDSSFAQLVQKGAVEGFDLYTLDDATEQDDDCGGIYHKSLLYLVSHALEAVPRIPFTKGKDGTPLLGLERDAKSIPRSFWGKANKWYVAPGAPQSHARHHGDFDDDPATLQATLQRITGSKQPPAGLGHIRSAQGIARQRRAIEHALSARAF